MPNGVFRRLISLIILQDEIVRAANEMADFVKQGLPRRHLLSLPPTMDPKRTYPGNYVWGNTFTIGTGLEGPIIFLVGIRGLFEQEQSLRLSDAEREALIRDNSRKLYLAATRAR
jgi:hypothetical protein